MSWPFILWRHQVAPHPASNRLGQLETFLCAQNALIGLRVMPLYQKLPKVKQSVRGTNKKKKYASRRTSSNRLWRQPSLLWPSAHPYGASASPADWLHRRVMASNTAPRLGPNAFLNWKIPAVWLQKKLVCLHLHYLMPEQLAHARGWRQSQDRGVQDVHTPVTHTLTVM